jgi:hypothetical protein
MAMRLAMLMQFHQSSASESSELDFVEKETRKRVFWLLCEWRPVPMR